MSQSRIPVNFEPYRIPGLARRVISPEGFIACPLPLLQAVAPEQLLWQNALYQVAFEQAQEELRPSLPERDLLGVWN